jgi:hypothetical protein
MGIFNTREKLPTNVNVRSAMGIKEKEFSL